jgi:hypothetical protein
MRCPEFCSPAEPYQRHGRQGSGAGSQRRHITGTEGVVRDADTLGLSAIGGVAGHPEAEAWFPPVWVSFPWSADPADGPSRIALRMQRTCGYAVPPYSRGRGQHREVESGRKE